MRQFFQRLRADTNGATAIEYGLIAAFIALALTASLPQIRSSLAEVFGNIGDDLHYAQKVSNH